MTAARSPPRTHANPAGGSVPERVAFWALVPVAGVIVFGVELSRRLRRAA